MGTYINKGNFGFQQARNSEYVDKSELIALVNSTLNTNRKYSCVTRARRFGKSMAAEMLEAYYDQSCDSRRLFEDLKIAGDASFEQHLNKYPVIYLDVTNFTTRDIPREELTDVIQREIIEEVAEAYPHVALQPDYDLMKVLVRVNQQEGVQFIMIIDEWDAICREASDTPEAMDRYVNLLRRMFKGSDSDAVFAGVYMTGILPIKKYSTQSALNNFQEYSMVEPRRMAPYFGFTKDEVRALAVKYGMDFDELEKWYDGYQIGDEHSMFNPNSVMSALDAGRCRSFWASTGAYDTVTNYIRMNFDGLKDSIISMLAGEQVKVNPTKFENDMSVVNSRDDVLTVLIHLGYLSYDWKRSVCYLPNREVAGEMVNAVEDNRWDYVAKALQDSERLLEALLRGDADAVARGVEAAHDENTALDQIRNRHYPQKVADYTGDLLLAGISYDRQSKLHSCRIEHVTTR